MKKLLSILLTILVSASITACAAKAPAQPSSQTAASTSTSASESKSSLRIVSGAPGTTEILVGLGLGQNIVAIDEYSKDIEGIPAGIPALDLYHPDVETIVALKPDFVFSSAINSLGGEDPFAIIKEAGIKVLTFDSTESLKGVMEDITKIAEATSAQDKGKELINEMNTEIDAIKAKAANIKVNKTVYFEIAPSPNIYTGGAGTIHNEMLEIVGAKNIFADKQGWISPSTEAVITLNPDVIITNVNYIDKPVDEIYARTGWQNINAVKNKQVIQVATNSTSRPSQNLTKGITELAKAIYPEEFK